MQFTVMAVSPETRSWNLPDGTGMLTYRLKGTFDGGVIPETVEINTLASKPKVPQTGEVIECTVSGTSPKGDKKIKRAQAGFGGQPAAAQTGPRAQESPDRQESIERQNSLTNAVAFCAARSQLLYSMDRADEALTLIDADTVLDYARAFAEYNAGKATIKEEAKAVFEQGAPTADGFSGGSDEFDTSDIPF